MNLNATLIGQLIAFVLFVAFCMKYVWPPLIKAIEERQANIANALASAEKAKQEQADSKAEADKEILKAKEEAQKIIDLATKRRNEILDRIYTTRFTYFMPCYHKWGHDRRRIVVHREIRH